MILREGNAGDAAALLEIWEASVRATHDFLQEEDIQFYKNIITTQQVFNQVTLICAVDEQGNIAGFAGVAAGNLEMLFVHPGKTGKGLGKQLLLHTIEKYNVDKVDVNEQNTHAKGFYEHGGFIVESRSELDGTGKPFPILHMKLAGNAGNGFKI